MLRVVIVEDEEIIRRGLVLTIDWQAMGCEIAGEAADGRQGLAVISETQPDIIITDIKMPQLDGLQMIEQAQTQRLLKADCRVLLLTSYAEFDYARQAIHLQVYDYLLKPLEETKLQQVIDRIKAERPAEAADNSNNRRLVNWAEYLNDELFLNSYVKEALLKIKDDYQARISVENLAEEMNISASYLSRKFKEATGHTFLELLSRQRIDAAVKLLGSGKYRVYEVAEQVGFNDYKNFCLVFKRYMNKPPKEYMNECGQ